MKKKILPIFLCFLLCSVLSGCGSAKKKNEVTDESVTAFDNEMDRFMENVEKIGTRIEQIDVTDADYRIDFLSSIDELKVLFDSLMTVQEPQNNTRYTHYDQLAKTAAYYMNEASKYYHLMLDEDYNPTFEEYANDCYDEAYQNIQYIGYMMNGADVEGVLHDVEYEVTAQ